jgi:hypothetical protein
MGFKKISKFMKGKGSSTVLCSKGEWKDTKNEDLIRRD